MKSYLKYQNLVLRVIWGVESLLERLYIFLLAFSIASSHENSQVLSNHFQLWSIAKQINGSVVNSGDDPVQICHNNAIEVAIHDTGQIRIRIQDNFPSMLCFLAHATESLLERLLNIKGTSSPPFPISSNWLQLESSSVKVLIVLLVFTTFFLLDDADDISGRMDDTSAVDISTVALTPSLMVSVKAWTIYFLLMKI